jgi:Yip1 domain
MSAAGKSPFSRRSIPMLDRLSYGATLIDRLRAALRLDLHLYQEVSADAAATGEAVRVVLLAGLSNGLSLVPRLGVAGIVAGVGAGLIGWLLWAGVVFVVAASFRHHRNGRSLLRAAGFADAPGVFLILGVIPTLGSMVRAVVVVWLVVATVPAVQAVYEVPRRRAVLIASIAFLAYLLLGVVSAHYTVS